MLRNFGLRPLGLHVRLDGGEFGIRKRGRRQLGQFSGHLPIVTAGNAHVFHSDLRRFINGVQEGKLLKRPGMHSQLPAELIGGARFWGSILSESGNRRQHGDRQCVKLFHKY
jgi:hypothetical protein